MQIIQHWKALHKVACVCLSPTALDCHYFSWNWLTLFNVCGQNIKERVQQKGIFQHQECQRSRIVQNIPGEHSKHTSKTFNAAKGRVPPCAPGCDHVQRIESVALRAGHDTSPEGDSVDRIDVKQNPSKKNWNKSSIRSDIINKTWPSTRVENSKP